ncbi:KDP operon transcriptional regulatory protein KdpE [Anatilimnocola aggregata]|uniref:KDP operon transcriptional regulatory protein KdpE n=1 Tax=Anatilimnocola aggregata TaxID=2528021 RepID=A0A517Y923_9BACT|nr:response regulator [Anatilimnocola aggregata]QDU26738.1 KDP operon transcriptional regulatory protein KdpE [Anatilimnocola aggregata]
MTHEAPLILIIEDEAPIRRFLRASLSEQGYRFNEAESAQDGLRLAASQPPDLIVLDLGLPDQNGLEVLRQIRDWSSVPIIIVSARGQEHDKVTALDLGANDYLTKPFGVGELFARIRVALRLACKMPAEPVFATGELKVDLTARRVWVQGQEVHLTPTEYRLLTTLIRDAGKVLTQSYLLKEVWGPGHAQEGHYLRVAMAKLRSKIESEPARPRIIITEVGVGYRLNVTDSN